MRVPFLASGNCHMHSKSGRCTKRAKDERGEEKRGKKEVEEAKETEEDEEKRRVYSKVLCHPRDFDSRVHVVVHPFSKMWFGNPKTILERGLQVLNSDANQGILTPEFIL